MAPARTKSLLGILCFFLLACSNSTEPTVETFAPVVIIDLQPAAGHEYSDRYIHWVFIADPHKDENRTVFTQSQRVDCHLPDTINMPAIVDIQRVELLYGVGDSVTCGIASDLSYQEQELSFLLHPIDTIRISIHDLEFAKK